MIWKIILSLFRGPARPNSARVCALVCVGGSSYPSQLLHVLTKHINGHGDLDVFHCDGQLLLLADRQAEWRGAKLCWKFTLQFVIVNSSALKHNMSPLRSSGLDERREEKKRGWEQLCHWVGSMDTIHQVFAESDPWHQKAWQRIPLTDNDPQKYTASFLLGVIRQSFRLSCSKRK